MLYPDWKIVCMQVPSMIYLRSWLLKILKNQYRYVSLFISCLIEHMGWLILYRTSSSSHIAINSLISLWVHSVLPLLLSLFDIRHLQEEHEDVEGFATDTIQLTATCSWFCAILLEFSSMFFCKISFSSSSNARLPFSILKENGRCIQNQPMGVAL